MRHLSVPLKLTNNIIHLHDRSFLERQRIAGKCLAEVMTLLQSLLAQKMNLSLLELDKIAEEEILKRNCIPTFKGYKGFPNAVCISVNKQLVHGIPTEYRLEEGDVISLDFGATYDGAIADSATTQIYGEPKSKEHVKMVDTVYQCLYNSIKAIKPGLKTGVISNAIFKTARNAGYRVIESLGGHGIAENKVHAAPFISNKGAAEDGVRMFPGLSLAIEPLIVPINASAETYLAKDGWTISTEAICAHSEHSIFIHTDHVEILSHRENENFPKIIPYEVL